jgi:hypothetical protein
MSMAYDSRKMRKHENVTNFKVLSERLEVPTKTTIHVTRGSHLRAHLLNTTQERQHLHHTLDTSLLALQSYVKVVIRFIDVLCQLTMTYYCNYLTGMIQVVAYRPNCFVECH